MGKDKKEKKEKTPSKTKEDASDGGDGELRPVCAIAKPLADIGFHKKILKVVKKGACLSRFSCLVSLPGNAELPPTPPRMRTRPRFPSFSILPSPTTDPPQTPPNPNPQLPSTSK
jgi:hypothetical protein|tara:strand:+ start:280 stop:624 length:345 start_codon:yes stop_codon:yes gene_type:complete